MLILKNIKKKLWYRWFRAPKLDEIINVKSLLDCERYASEILSEIESSGVVFMGFDCEWVGKNKTGMIYFSAYSLSDVSIATTWFQCVKNQIIGVVVVFCL